MAYNHTITLLAHQNDWSDANQLALVLGDQKGDSQTFIEANATSDPEGLVSGEWFITQYRVQDDRVLMLTNRTLSAPDHSPDVDLEAAYRALDKIKWYIDTDVSEVLNTYGLVEYSPPPPEPSPPPAPPVPEAVTMRQARLVLLSIGMLDTVETIIKNIPGPDGRAAQIEWEFASEVRRDSPMIVTLGQQLGLTATQIDQLFIIAQDI